MLLQLQFYLDTREGHRVAGETVLFGSTTLDYAIRHAEGMLANRSFSFGKANLCLIKDADGNIIREIRSKNAMAPRP